MSVCWRDACELTRLRTLCRGLRPSHPPLPPIPLALSLAAGWSTGPTLGLNESVVDISGILDLGLTLTLQNGGGGGGGGGPSLHPAACCRATRRVCRKL